MKRLLTYGLLLLTILASHFVVSACQDDLPETTEVMVTFTTRAISGGAASTAPEIEQMHDLRVIMLRSDGTIVGKDQYTPEGDFNPSSVRFTFSTTIPNPSGEDFTFLAIANEEYVDEELPWSTRGIGDKLTQSEIESITVDTDIKSEPIPQTDYWTVHVPQTQNHQVKETLKFAASKISVVFQNETKEAQSLSDIRITGIGSASAGYLFKQTKGDDFVGERHADTDITFTDVTNLAAGDTSEELTYYTYPVGSVSSPTLFATWNGEEYNLPITEVTDEEGNVHPFTSLKRNERLKIVITLTPAGDITVNYTIAEWEETPTNIGDTAPTTPDNDNRYNTEDWGASNDIEIGGGGQIWNLGNGTTIKGEQGWTYSDSEFEVNDRIQLNLPDSLIEPGNTIILYFEPYTYDQEPSYDTIRVKFATGWDDNDYPLGDKYESYKYESGKEYVKYLTITEGMMTINDHSLKSMNLVIYIRDEDDNPIHIKVSKLLLVVPT